MSRRAMVEEHMDTAKRGPGWFETRDHTPDGWVVTRYRHGQVLRVWRGKAALARLRRECVVLVIGRVLVFPLMVPAVVLVGIPTLAWRALRHRAWMRRCDRDPAFQCEHGTPMYQNCWECCGQSPVR